ncbi:hypothetical protein IFM89_013194 [Coptis chinensis]|uniref:DNA-(apurinic or apyrimidinic site) endonuclease n=1 Tax=Coptis chinensis TaxID=261450 RepID=A0A835HVD9_9MAGN|nr:hypothetical protein IFM89_013194 [Coptis chinensis]
MKRFFQPVNKDGSLFKKPNLSPTPAPVDKADNENEEKNKKEPLKFVTWNANSFLLRVKNNWPQFTSFIHKLDPDVIAIQEVRMPAAGSKGSAKNPGELKDDTTSSGQEKQVYIYDI